MRSNSILHSLEETGGTAIGSLLKVVPVGSGLVVMVGVVNEVVVLLVILLLLLLLVGILLLGSILVNGNVVDGVLVNMRGLDGVVRDVTVLHRLVWVVLGDMLGVDNDGMVDGDNWSVDSVDWGVDDGDDVLGVLGRNALIDGLSVVNIGLVVLSSSGVLGVSDGGLSRLHLVVGDGLTVVAGVVVVAEVMRDTVIGRDCIVVLLVVVGGGVEKSTNGVRVVEISVWVPSVVVPDSAVVSGGGVDFVVLVLELRGGGWVVTGVEMNSGVSVDGLVVVVAISLVIRDEGGLVHITWSGPAESWSVHGAQCVVGSSGNLGDGVVVGGGVGDSGGGHVRSNSGSGMEIIKTNGDWGGLMDDSWVGISGVAEDGVVGERSIESWGMDGAVEGTMDGTGVGEVTTVVRSVGVTPVVFLGRSKSNNGCEGERSH